MHGLEERLDRKCLSEMVTGEARVSVGPSRVLGAVVQVVHFTTPGASVSLRSAQLNR